MTGGHPAAQAGVMNRTDVRGTFREMWETRPARPRQDRQVAGVSTAIARRYDIDPVLVRIGFVVAAIAGIGAFLYIAGWVLLPEETADPAAPVPARPPRTPLVIGLGIAVAVAVGFLVDFPGVLLPTAAVGVLLFLLHRSRGHRVLHLGVPIGSAPGWAGTSADRPAHGAGPSAPGPSAPGVSLRKDQPDVPTVAITAERTPPSWDPLGAAPFAWDLPEPSPAPPSAPPARRLPVTAVTLGLALLTGGVTALVLLLAGALTIAALPVLFGVVLAVLGTGLVIGSFLRAGRGLIPIAAILGVLTWGLVAAPLGTWQSDGFGELRAAPTTAADLRPRYAQSVGQITLDLRNLDLSVPPGGDGSALQTEVEVGVGEIEVRLPPDADLRVTAEVGMGEVRTATGADSGPGAEVQGPDDLGADGVRSGRLLVLDVQAGVGEVEVRRG